MLVLMRKTFFYLLWVAGSGLFLNHAPAQSAGQPVENALFWEITGKGIKKPSYLFGTIHIIPEKDFFIPKVMEERLSEPDQLVLEVDMDGMSLVNAMMGMMSGMMMPKDTSLRTLLSESDYKYLQQYVRDSLPGNSTMSMGMLNRMKPVFSAQQLSSLICQESEAPDNNSSYELYLTELFSKSGRPVSGLETAEMQMAVLDQIPLNIQAGQLMEVVRNGKNACGEMEELIATYVAQDLGRMLELTAGDPSLGNYMDQLLDARNRNWIPQIEDLLKSKSSVLVAVGAGHLGGPGGVVNLLREKGYTLKALRDR